GTDHRGDEAVEVLLERGLLLLARRAVGLRVLGPLCVRLVLWAGGHADRIDTGVRREPRGARRSASSWEPARAPGSGRPRAPRSGAPVPGTPRPAASPPLGARPRC